MGFLDKLLGRSKKTAGDVMSRAIAAVGPAESLGRFAHLMVERQVKRLPALDADGQLIWQTRVAPATNSRRRRRFC